MEDVRYMTGRMGRDAKETAAGPMPRLVLLSVASRNAQGDVVIPAGLGVEE